MHFITRLFYEREANYIPPVLCWGLRSDHGASRGKSVPVLLGRAKPPGPEARDLESLLVNSFSPGCSKTLGCKAPEIPRSEVL